jgi:hypothetical protein
MIVGPSKVEVAVTLNVPTTCKVEDAAAVEPIVVLPAIVEAPVTAKVLESVVAPVTPRAPPIDAAPVVFNVAPFTKPLAVKFVPDALARVVLPVISTVEPSIAAPEIFKVAPFKNPLAVKFVPDALARVALPVTFKIPPRFTSPEAVRAVEETAAKVDAPVTLRVEPSVAAPVAWKVPMTWRVLEALAREPTVRLVPIAPVVVALKRWTSVPSYWRYRLPADAADFAQPESPAVLYALAVVVIEEGVAPSSVIKLPLVTPKPNGLSV